MRRFSAVISALRRRGETAVSKRYSTERARCLDDTFAAVARTRAADSAPAVRKGWSQATIDFRGNEFPGKNSGWAVHIALKRLEATADLFLLSRHRFPKPIDDGELT